MHDATDRSPWAVGLGRVRGTEVQVSASCLLVVALIAVVFAPRADALVPGPPAQAFLVGAAVGVLVYLAALVHESSHAVVARRHGHRVPWIRLTGSGGRTRVVGESATPGEEAATAAAGPVLSLALGLLALAARGVVTDGAGALVLEALVVANLLIGVLDLVPAPPLDGGRLVRAAAWRVSGSRARGAVVAAHVGRATAVVVVLALATWTLVAGAPGLSAWVIGLGVAALTWTAASAGLPFERLRHRVEDVPVAAAMRPTAGAVPTTTPERSVPHDRTLDEVLVVLVRAPTVEHAVVDDAGVVRGVLALGDVERAAARYGSAGAGE